MDEARAWRAARSLPTTALGDALGGGALPARLRPLDRSFRICGPALPVATTPGDNGWLHRALAVARPGEVLVVATGETREVGYWGELMTLAALALRLGGLVLEGAVRDLLDLVRLEWPIFASGVCLRRAGKAAEAEGSVGEPIRLGGVVVARGDLVAADADGVVVVPSGQVVEAVRRATREQRREERVRRSVAGGTPLAEALGLELDGSSH